MLRALILYRNPVLDNVVPTSRNTTRSWIIKAHQQSKGAVRLSLARAKTRITLSFDAWKSDNVLDLLGILAHYIDEHYRVKNVLLALRNTYGSHAGVEMKHHLLEVSREYQIGNKLSFLIADNTSNNDTAINLLAAELDMDPKKQRLRCAAHIINLVVKATLSQKSSSSAAKVRRCRPAVLF